MSVKIKKLSPTVLLAVAATLIAAAPATAAATGTVKERTRLAADCGLYRDGDAAMYKNCTGAGENIFVTYLLGGNTYFCVAPGESKYVGRWSNVFRVYNRGGC
ncbi:DUF6355 family natural product biosynthesis protein [Nonomuraea sp. NPDC050451]|uniref:DUF6355 family natural product biosynthesis protein n=1 Tax=Nonomuraea sp. NPDC050451 TaxID=3364364 RepID=UPI0037B529D7